MKNSSFSFLTITMPGNNSVDIMNLARDCKLIKVLMQPTKIQAMIS